LLCGALVALIATGRQRAADRANAHGRVAVALVVASVLALVWLAHAIPSAADYSGRAALAVTVASVALLAGLELLPPGRVGRALGARPMAATGRLSYSLYLWHWPVFVFAPLLAARYGWGILRNRPFELVLVVVIALASYHLLEQPIRFRLWRRAPAPAVLFAGLALSATIAVVAVPWLGPTSDASREALAAVKDLARPVNDCPYFAQDWPSAADSRPCLVRAGGPYTVALVGDSHAQMWAPTLDALARRFGFTFVTVTRGGCPANDILVYHLSDEGQRTPDHDCSDWRDQTYRRLLADYHPNLVVMSTRSYVDGIVDGGRDVTPRDPAHLQLWSDGFVREARLLAGNGATVLVSEILPTLPQRVPACLAEHTSTTNRCDFPAAGDALRAAYNAAILALPSEVPNVRTFDPRTIVCPGDVCPARIDDVIVHRDDNHITATFATLVVDQFLALLRRAGIAFR
jgi:hypothetical protein